MEHLGGLIHRCRSPPFAFLVGSVAISALPPFNGFVSEWLTFQAILLSPRLPQWLLKFLVPAVGAMLALSAALAAGCFVKAFGVTFLGRPRTRSAETRQETDAFSLAAMFLLVALCLLAGILPGYFIDALAPVTQLLLGAQLPPQEQLKWLTIVPIARKPQLLQRPAAVRAHRGRRLAGARMSSTAGLRTRSRRSAPGIAGSRMRGR